MSAEMIMQAISTIGFPIVACGALAWYVWYQSKQHKAEIDNLANIVANNTKAVEELTQLVQDLVEIVKKHA